MTDQPSEPKEEETVDPAHPATPEVIARLVASHREFLGFLERRLPNRQVAEEILQAAFVRAIERGGAIRNEESALAWFYRLLRNSLTDHYRKQAAGREVPAELDQDTAFMEPELKGAICTCMGALLPTLKPEYADIVRRVDLEERPIGEVAVALGISSNNATVRLHRGRQALKRQLERSCGTCATHGCLDCTCAQAPPNLG
jgi:RNA polymerase sigma-70 factor (ECF subfamily)